MGLCFSKHFDWTRRRSCTSDSTWKTCEILRDFLLWVKQDLGPWGPLVLNILFREFVLVSMWRVPAMRIGAYTLLSFLAEPLKQPTETLLFAEDHDVSENLREFQDWEKKIHGS